MSTYAVSLLASLEKSNSWIIAITNGTFGNNRKFGKTRPWTYIKINFPSWRRSLL